MNKTMEKVVLVEGSHGNFLIDRSTGKVLTPADEIPSEYALFSKADVAEHLAYWGREDFMFDSVDVLNLGFWLVDGRYEQACEDFRLNTSANKTMGNKYHINWNDDMSSFSIHDADGECVSANNDVPCDEWNNDACYDAYLTALKSACREAGISIDDVDE